VSKKLVGWLVFALVLIALAYGLNRGLYVGSAINISSREGAGNLLYAKSCRYLHFDGVHGLPGAETHSQDEAQAAACAVLQD
jgi:hypothetical protein